LSSLDDTASDFATVGDQNFGKHLVLLLMA